MHETAPECPTEPPDDPAKRTQPGRDPGPGPSAETPRESVSHGRNSPHYRARPTPTASSLWEKWA
jgi:hypothetical protein